MSCSSVFSEPTFDSLIPFPIDWSFPNLVSGPRKCLIFRLGCSLHGFSAKTHAPSFLLQTLLDIARRKYRVYASDTTSGRLYEATGASTKISLQLSNCQRAIPTSWMTDTQDHFEKKIRNSDWYTCRSILKRGWKAWKMIFFWKRRRQGHGVRRCL